jgi:hypothetical protein
MCLNAVADIKPVPLDFWCDCCRPLSSLSATLTPCTGAAHPATLAARATFLFWAPVRRPCVELGFASGRPEDDDSPPVVGSGEKKRRARHEASEGRGDTGLSTVHTAFDLDASCSGG